MLSPPSFLSSYLKLVAWEKGVIVEFPPHSVVYIKTKTSKKEEFTMEVSFVSEHRGRLSLMGGDSKSNEIHVPDKRSGVSPNTFVVVGEKRGEFQTKGPKLIFRQCHPLLPRELKELSFSCWEGVGTDADIEFLGLVVKEARVRITFKVSTRSSFADFDMKSELVETMLPPEVIENLYVEGHGSANHRVWLNQNWKGFKASSTDINMIYVKVTDDLLGQWKEFAQPFLQAVKDKAEKRQREGEEKRTITIEHFFEDHPELRPVGVVTWDVMFDIAIKGGVAEHRSSSGYWGGKREDIWREGSQWYVLKIRGEEFTRN